MKEGWIESTIGDCFFSIKNGANIKQVKGATGIPITRIETLSNGIFNRDRLGYANIGDVTKYESYILNDGDILVSHINSMKYIGRAVLYKKKGNETIIHGMNLLSIVSDKTKIIPDFARYYFQTESYKKDIQSISNQSVNQASFNVTSFKKISFKYPSLSEQNRIVEKLDAAFEKIDRLKKNAEEGLQEVKNLWEARLSNLFEAKDGWTNSNLGSLVDFKNGVNFTPSENGTKIKFLGVGDFKDRETVTSSDLDYISTNQTIDNEYHLQKDDIIIVRSNGSKTLVGRTVIFNENIDEPLIYSGFCIRCRIKDKSLLLPAFLNILFRTTKVKRHLTYGDNGCNISNINQKKLSSLQISYPSLEDQKKIVEEYEILSSLCKRLTFNYEKELAEYEALKQSILRKAFSGEL